MPPESPPAANLTQAGNLKNWSESEFIRARRTGVRPDGSMLRPPMPWQGFAQMTDTELKALYLYLKTVPAAQ